MENTNYFDIGIILTIGCLLPLFHFSRKSKRASFTKLFSYGLLCALFGVTFSFLQGNELYDILLLHKTSGFGRAYVAGLGILLAAVIVACLTLATRKGTKQIGNVDGNK